MILVLPTQVQTSSSVATSSQITSQLLSPTTSTFQPVILLSEEIAGTYHTQPVQHLKRTTQSSPINFPSKLTHSPCPKRFKRARTFSEAHKLHCHSMTLSLSAPCLNQLLIHAVENQFLSLFKAFSFRRIYLESFKVPAELLVVLFFGKEDYGQWKLQSQVQRHRYYSL